MGSRGSMRDTRWMTDKKEFDRLVDHLDKVRYNSPGEALSLVSPLLGEARAIRDERAIAVFAYIASGCHRRQERMEEAIRLASEALDRLEKLDEPHHLVRALNVLGLCYGETGARGLGVE